MAKAFVSKTPSWRRHGDKDTYEVHASPGGVYGPVAQAPSYKQAMALKKEIDKLSGYSADAIWSLVRKHRARWTTPTEKVATFLRQARRKLGKL